MINININIENSDKEIKEIRESLQTLASCIVKLYEWCRNGKAQQDALQKINQAIHDSFVHKGGLKRF